MKGKVIKMKLTVNAKELHWEVENELKLFNVQGGTSFKGMLYGLICKASRHNLHNIALGFPLQVVAWYTYQEMQDRLEGLGFEVVILGGNENE
ncbi:hypothetical protein [Bacillus cereus group sp. MYBK215-2]|uniref:hypothetical protein n=2 Tax=unclassified Bacillus cereus group TaxID=2750818 RepID=UPI003F7A8E67